MAKMHLEFITLEFNTVQKVCAIFNLLQAICKIDLEMSSKIALKGGKQRAKIGRNNGSEMDKKGSQSSLEN